MTLYIGLYTAEHKRVSPKGHRIDWRFYLFLPQRAAAPFLAMARRLAGLRDSARATPRRTAASLTTGFSFGNSPIATSTMNLASWAVSRGRFGVAMSQR